MRDLSLSGHLGELLDLGVCSFKIEGRLKDKGYVQNVVAHYRNELDAAMAERGLRRASSGASEPGFVPDLGKTFNRGYCTYFLHGATDPVGSVDTPKMTGEFMGTVVRVAGRRVELDRNAPLHAGDGICYPRFGRCAERHDGQPRRRRRQLRPGQRRRHRAWHGRLSKPGPTCSCPSSARASPSAGLG